MAFNMSYSVLGFSKATGSFLIAASMVPMRFCMTISAWSMQPETDATGSPFESRSASASSLTLAASFFAYVYSNVFSNFWILVIVGKL